ncbi:hypothetical protein TSUD_152640 [Trifolium subterraneum]|uniref:Uncharacterized protein n=1 Tax=Trifolium subterraneum TaxID=3900 RepID=A0A2Z6MK51_TRISU|nr:hypothetical protein TSUD_152640 [Trifolium subterraneum]
MERKTEHNQKKLNRTATGEEAEQRPQNDAIEQNRKTKKEEDAIERTSESYPRWKKHRGNWCGGTTPKGMIAPPRAGGYIFEEEDWDEEV